MVGTARKAPDVFVWGEMNPKGFRVHTTLAGIIVRSVGYALKGFMVHTTLRGILVVYGMVPLTSMGILVTATGLLSHRALPTPETPTFPNSLKAPYYKNPHHRNPA